MEDKAVTDNAQEDPKMGELLHLRQFNEAMQAFASVSAVRGNMLGALGYQYQGDRDLYKAFGYLKTPEFNDWLAQFTREDLARTVVAAPVDEAWRRPPQLVEDDTPDVETEFEKAWTELERTHSVNHFLRRLDLVSGIGRYGVLFMGLSDVRAISDMAQPVQPGTDLRLLFLTPLSEGNAMINTWVTDVTSPRFGMPETYTLSIHTPGTLSSANVRQGRRAPFRDERGRYSSDTTYTMVVHWTRVLHVAEGLLENNVFGTPRLEPVLNRLMDLQKTVGGSAEAFFRAGHPGLHVDARLDADGASLLGTTELAALKEQIKDYIHNFERVIRTQGVDVKQLAPAIASPKDTFDVVLSCISGTTRIPKRILIGSERGELASSQDESNWVKTVQARQKHHLEPMVVRKFVERMQELGVLPEAEFDVVWPPLMDDTPKERAEVAKTITEALTKYASSPGADLVIPPGLYRELVLRFDTEQLKRIEESVAAAIDEERRAIADQEGQEPDEDEPPGNPGGEGEEE